jgi:beta-fructofuranosidase
MPSATQTTSVRYSRPSDSQAAADAIPILVDGEYHIFHLSTPPNTVRHPPRLRSTWSRLRSRDLVSWTRDEVEALYPGKSRDSPDADGAWTGSAIIGPDGNMHLFYTGYCLGQGGKQVIIHARSSDKQGSAFSKTLSPISISGDMSQFEDIDFRDAHVSWNEVEGCYWMLVATRLRTGPYWTRGCFALLTSVDLEEWKIDAKPFYAPNDMFCPECPEIFSLPNGNWYLVYSRFHSPDAGTVYRIAESPRGPFRTPRRSSGGRFDARRWYAAKSCPKAGDPSKRVYFGWVADKLEDQWSWGGDMGMPREVSANKDGSLIVEPCRDYLNTCFQLGPRSSLPGSISLSNTGETITRRLPVDEGMDYSLEFELASQDAASFGLSFRTDEDNKGHRLRFVPTAHGSFDVSLLSCPPPLDDFWADQYDLHLPREVDGPELARHSDLTITGSVVVTVMSDVLEIFAGGKSISYRLPCSNPRNDSPQNGHVNGNGDGALRHNKDRAPVQELGVFVEDGGLALVNVSLCWIGLSTSQAGPI